MASDFDTLWKLESVRIAATEQLEIEGELKFKELFERSKQIYNEGYKEGLDRWQSIWMGPSEESIVTETQKKPKKKIIPEMGLKEGQKKCPACGEIVPASWRKHTYKKDRSVCGHFFEIKK